MKEVLEKVQYFIAMATQAICGIQDYDDPNDELEEIEGLLWGVDERIDEILNEHPEWWYDEDDDEDEDEE